MTDRELLEFAAKAAGIVVERSRLDDPACRDFLVMNSARNVYQKYGPWNPLVDDGDALRLAVELRLDLCWATDEANIVSVWCAAIHDFVEKSHGVDKFAATRKCIVRAAAEIGKAMP